MSPLKHKQLFDSNGDFLLELSNTSHLLSYCVITTDDDLEQVLVFSKRFKLRVVCPEDPKSDNVAFTSLCLKVCEAPLCNKGVLKRNKDLDTDKIVSCMESDVASECEVSETKPILAHSHMSVSENDLNEYLQDETRNIQAERVTQSSLDNISHSDLLNSRKTVKVEAQLPLPSDEGDELTDDEALLEAHTGTSEPPTSLSSVIANISAPLGPETILRNSRTKTLFNKVKRPSAKISKPRVCKFCEKEFSSFAAFQKHCQNPYFYTSKSSHKCTKCKNAYGLSSFFPTKAAFLAHNIVHHADSARDYEDGTDKSAKYPCPNCDIHCKSESLLAAHIKQHTGEYHYVCCRCGQYLDKWAKHKNCQSVMRFKCSECDARYETRGELNAHKTVHHVKCSYCGIEFLSTVSLNQHIVIAHSKDGLRCHICQKLVRNETHLESHLRNHKYKDKVKQQCPICGVLLNNLKQHLLCVHNMHNPAKSFACDKCPKIFPTMYHFKNHYTEHTGERPYACDFCPKTFRRKGYLSKHLHIHNKIRSYVCEVCGHKSTTSFNLKIHRRIHSDNKLFPCPFCEKRFNYKASLQGHVKSQHQSVSFNDAMLNLNLNAYKA